MSEPKPTLSAIRRTNGVAGQVQFTVTVSYTGEPDAVVSFVGYVDGGPVVMVSAGGAQTIVKDPERFGKFGPEWVRWFFSTE